MVNGVLFRSRIGIEPVVTFGRFCIKKIEDQHMRYIILFLFTGLFSLHNAAQTAEETIAYVIGKTPVLVEKITRKEKEFVVYLETGFNDAVYTNKSDLQQLNGKQIIKVELVYTTYRKSETFDQHTLNRKRLKALFDAVPNALTQGGIEWILTGQTGCTSPEMGKDFFHGVIITYRPPASDLISRLDADFLRQVNEGKVPLYAYDAFLKQELKKAALDTLPADDPGKQHTFQAPEFRQGVRSRIDFYTRNLHYPSGNVTPQQVLTEFTIDKDGKVVDIQFPNNPVPNEFTKEIMRFLRTMPDWRPGVLDSAKTTLSRIQQTIEFTERGSIIPSPIYSYSTEAPPKKEIKIPGVDYSKVRPTNAALAVVQILQRNKWENSALVVDVTGSMAQYSAQVLEYLKAELNGKTNKYSKICFFNDGNKRADRGKKVGETGGVYVFPVSTVDEVMEKMIQVMAAGDGGDIPENNIEALKLMQDSCSNCTSLVMIADNYSIPRDMSLLSSIKVPVHVIVCTNSAVLNAAYLNIAYQTKGSVHFNGKDLYDLYQFEEGATVQVLKETFVLKGGKFVLRKS